MRPSKRLSMVGLIRGSCYDYPLFGLFSPLVLELCGCCLVIPSLDEKYRRFALRVRTTIRSKLDSPKGELSMSRTRFQKVAHISFRERTGSLRAPLLFLMLVAATAATSSAQTFKTLYNFCSVTSGAGYCLDGQNPSSSLVQGANGNLYGTTTNGGTANDGTVFEITTAGKLTTIYNFCSQASCADGYGPQGGLVLATNGSFYGVTISGGSGYGTVFKITSAGKLTTLHSFNNTDGESPTAGLIQATDGNFYGTTNSGGAYSQGTAFEITASGTFTSLHNFCGGLCLDGASPMSGLIQAADGNFYGTAYDGGGPNDVNACSPYSGGGAAFQLTSSGALTPLVPIFCEPNGFYPNSAPVQAADGNLYGTTAAGGDGSNTGSGTFYEMTTTGSLTWLHSFCLQTGCADGSNPQALILGTDGNFYGTTKFGGANSGTGTVFQITSTGQLTTLHTFTGPDGINPVGALLLDTSGTFYGTTWSGGAHGVGTIFSLAPGAFVATIPTSGAGGTKVTILGTNLKGATGVSFNGTAVTSMVVSGSEITTTVPTGATSGTVTVTIPGGTTLKSKVAFQVP